MGTMNTRHWALRKMEQAQGNIDWCGSHLQEVKEKYQDPHPEIAEPIQLLQENLAICYELLSRIKEKI